MADCLNHSDIHSNYELINTTKHLNDSTDLKYNNNKMLMNDFSTLFNQKGLSGPENVINGRFDRE